jgi:hypothetical protein
MSLTLAVLLVVVPCQTAEPGGSPEAAAAGRALLEQPSGPAPDRAALEAVFRRPGFERARDRSRGALGAFLSQLRAWLERLFETSGAEAYSNVTRVLVLFAGALVGLFAALRFAARRRAPPTKPHAAEVGTLPLESPAAHLARARASLANAPRAAIREGLFALLSHLERERWARPDRVKTNRELARELPARGAPAELTAIVERLLEWYDRAFYSLEPVPGDAAEDFVAQVAELSTTEEIRR